MADAEGRGHPRGFPPPLAHAQVKALACERVFYTHLPFSRQSLADLSARASGYLRPSISRRSVWHILHRDAIAPWRYEHWIFPRDPHFVEKAMARAGP